jgi:hypothetical protein
MLEVKQSISFYSNGYLYKEESSSDQTSGAEPVKSCIMCAIIGFKEQAVDWFVDDSNTNLNENRK